MYASGDAVFSTDGQRIYVVLFPHYYRPSVGLCALVSLPIEVYQGADFFEYDLATRTLRHLGSHRADRAFRISMSTGAVTFRRRGADRLYAVAEGYDVRRVGQPDAGRVLYYEIDMERGATREVSPADFSRAASTLELVRPDYRRMGRAQFGRRLDWWGPARQSAEGHYLRASFNGGQANETSLRLLLFDPAAALDDPHGGPPGVLLDVANPLPPRF